MRERIIAGNWKMHKTSAEAVSFIKGLTPCLADVSDAIFLAVPFTTVEAAAKAAEGTKVVVGAQNMCDAASGAFTGEVSAEMLKAAGAHFVIVGHSERRHLFGETDALVNRKVLRAVEEGLRPLLCVGETLLQREEGLAQETLEQQLCASLAQVTPDLLSRVILAYEPVWAIGTGRTATPDMAQQAHQHLRHVIEEHWGSGAAAKTSILYGGSVKSSNAAALMAESDIDGLLVGGASLEVDSFSQIIHYHSLVSGS